MTPLCNHSTQRVRIRAIEPRLATLQGTFCPQNRDDIERLPGFLNLGLESLVESIFAEQHDPHIHAGRRHFTDERMTGGVCRARLQGQQRKIKDIQPRVAR